MPSCYFFFFNESSVRTNKEQGLHTDKSAGNFIILFSIKTCPRQHQSSQHSSFILIMLAFLATCRNRIFQYPIKQFQDTLMIDIPLNPVCNCIICFTFLLINSDPFIYFAFYVSVFFTFSHIIWSNIKKTTKKQPTLALMISLVNK